MTHPRKTAAEIAGALIVGASAGGLLYCVGRAADTSARAARNATAYGDKYSKQMGGAEIAAAIRNDIKEAVKRGELPRAKYGARLHRFSGGKSITITYADVPFDLYNRAFLKFEIETGGRRVFDGDRWSPERIALEKKLTKIADAYNFDGSDRQTDYFNVNFYLHVDVDFEYDKRQRAIEKQRAQEELDENESPIYLSMQRRQGPPNGAADERNARDLAVANTIRAQLGAVTLAMLGAHDFVGWPDGVQFAIKGSPKKVTRIAIALAPDDTYTVEFFHGRGINIAKVAEHEGIYVDQLHDLIEHETGLYATMRRRQAPPEHGAVLEGVEAWIERLAEQNPKYTYGFDVGPVYIRIWRRFLTQDSRSVVNFVERTTGTIRKAESWKKAGRPVSTIAAVVAQLRDARARVGYARNGELPQAPIFWPPPRIHGVER